MKGLGGFDKELIELLKKGGFYTQEQILAHLNIDPSYSNLVKAMSKQLEALEEYGLVECKSRGCRGIEASGKTEMEQGLEVFFEFGAK